MVNHFLTQHLLGAIVDVLKVTLLAQGGISHMLLGSPVTTIGLLLDERVSSPLGLENIDIAELLSTVLDW